MAAEQKIPAGVIITDSTLKAMPATIACILPRMMNSARRFMA
jgi:hypothetical protein